MNIKQASIDIPKPKTFYGWFIALAGFMLLFCFAGSGFYSFGVFIKPLEVEFGWSRSAITFTISIYLMVLGLAAPVAGRLVQTIGPRKVMCIGAIGAGACFFMISFTRNLFFFYVLYALLALNMIGIGYIPVSTLIANWFYRRRGTAIGFVYMGISAGGMIFAPVIGQINMILGWRHAFVFLGLLVWFLAVPIVIIVIKESPYDCGLLPYGDMPAVEDEPPSSAHGNQKPVCISDSSRSLKESLSTKAFKWIVVTFFLGATAQMAVLQHQVVLMSGKGISYGTASTALGITSGMGGLGKFCFGWLTESLPFRWVVVLCYTLQAIGIMILLNLNTPSLIWFYAVIFGFGMGGVLVLQPLIVGQFFGLTSFSMLLGIITLGQSFGAAIGAFSAGLLYDHFGNYHHAMITFLIIYAMAICSIFMAGKPKPLTPQ
ncbi:MFS transporter [uncultured Desulfosarcina sp.]|uniref:MFS transporter n=1 Tax=uncultured Desulfosarcina sp. TaxID=218289 RepID=UPI0029C88014|nr:MFS transporter [uncultured Desulfosarcina sp.]